MPAEGERLVEAFVGGLLSTSPLEAVSVVLGFLYAAYAVRRVRWCWLAGGISSAILVYLAARARLPMQAALQAYYVAMAVYGFWHWSRKEAPARSVTTLPLPAHAVAWVIIVVVSMVNAWWLTEQTQAAWPLLDSLVTWTSLFATWLTARVKLESWLYWIVADSVAVFLFVAQGLMFVAVLFLAYLVISVIGFITWRRAIRVPVPAT